MFFELGPSFDFGFDFPSPNLLQVLIIMKHTPSIEEWPILRNFIIILLEFKDPFNGLHLIRMVLQVKIVIKF